MPRRSDEDYRAIIRSFIVTIGLLLVALAVIVATRGVW